jgi:hypothetical protein
MARSPGGNRTVVVARLRDDPATRAYAARRTAEARAAATSALPEAGRCPAALQAPGAPRPTWRPRPPRLARWSNRPAVTPVVLTTGVTARAAGRWRRPGRGERWCPAPTPRHLAAAARPFAAGQGPERPHRGACRRGGPGGQPLNEHRGGRGQQHDVVKLGVELPLVRRAAAQEQHLGVVAGQQLLDAVLSPHPVLPGTKAGWLVQGDGHPFGEPVVVGVDGLVAARGQLPDHRRLPGPRHPGEQHPLHRHNIAPGRSRQFNRTGRPRSAWIPPPPPPPRHPAAAKQLSNSLVRNPRAATVSSTGQR